MTDSSTSPPVLLPSELEGFLFQSNPEPMWIFEAVSLRFLAVNSAAAARYGYSADEFLALTVADIGLGGDLGGSWEHRTRAGDPFWADVTLHGVVFEGREARLAIIRDVTEDHRAGEENRVLADNMADVVSILDADGRCLYVSPSIKKATGHTVEEALSLCVCDAVHEDDLRRFDEAHRRALQQDGSCQMEWRRRCKDGTYRWFETKITRLEDQAGRPRRVIHESRDIQQRKEAEEALRRSQEQYRSIFENANEGIFRTTPQGRYLAANPALARIYGYASPEDLIARIGSIADRLYVSPGQRTEFVARMRAEAAIVDFEAQVRRRDGRVIWIRENAHAVQDEAGRLLYYEGTVEDITARKAGEEALRASEERYRGLVHSSPEAIFVYSEDRFVYANAAALALFGAGGPEELLGRSVFDIIHPDTLPVARERVRRSQVEGLASPLAEQKYVRLDGRVIHVERVSTPITWSGKPAGQVLARDISVRKALEAEREELLAQATARADRDSLTGLWNHRVFHKRLKEEDARSERCGTAYTVVLLDLDNFRFFNDAHGHAAGDDVLRRVAAVLQNACRLGDTLSRFGGDEFALLLPDTDADTGEEFVKTVAARLRDVGYRPSGYDTVVPLQLTHGLATSPVDGPTRQDTLAAADARLLRAKTGGVPDEAATYLRDTLSGTVEGFSMLDALVTAVDNKDRYTRRHSEDVLTHCRLIAIALGLDENSRHTLSVAALLHDLGKIGVPDHILRKPGALTEQEMGAVRQHPMMGSVIVCAVSGFEETLDAIRHHHERWDGLGYPFGLRAEECPLSARIMAVADAYSAMTMDRPYRVGMKPEMARAILAQGAGSQWDPACVQAFLRMTDCRERGGRSRSA